MGDMRGVRTGPAGPSVQKGRREVFVLFYFLFFYFEALSNHFKSNLNSFWI